MSEFKDNFREETYKSLISISMEVYKMLLVINGGAIVAILAFMGKMASECKPIGEFTVALYFFSGGVVSCALLMVFAYLTQFALYQSDTAKHNCFMKISFLFLFASIFCFFIGSLCAARAFGVSS